MNPFKATVYSGEKTSYQYSDMHKALHYCIFVPIVPALVI